MTLKLDENTYTAISTNKRGCILDVIKQAEEYIYSQIIN
jgi:hypothetical protein